MSPSEKNRYTLWYWVMNKYHVSIIDTINIAGHYRKMYEISEPVYSNKKKVIGKIIEGIGDVNGFLQPDRNSKLLKYSNYKFTHQFK